MILLFSFDGFAQINQYPTGGWRFTSLTGSVKLNGLYRNQDRILKDFEEIYETVFFSGGLLLNSHSYIWHPDFLMIDANIEVNPGTYNVECGLSCYTQSIRNKDLK